MRGCAGRKILVTGATGFIGRHLAVNLVGRGWRVVATTRNRRLRGGGGLRYLECDLTSRRRCREAILPLKDIRRVIHCAALMPGRHVRNPARDFRRHNLDATINLLTSLPPGVEKVVLVSTIDVYGAPQHEIIRETHPLCPCTYYGVYKLASEGVCRVFCDRRNMDLVVLRVAQVYGEGEPGLKVIPRFIEAALKGCPLVIEGDGRQKRSYIYVRDVAEALRLALEKDMAGTYNLGGPRGTSIVAVARLINEIASNPNGIIFKDASAVRPSIVIDSGAIRRKLKFRPTVTMETGLRRQIGRMRTGMNP